LAASLRAVPAQHLASGTPAQGAVVQRGRPGIEGYLVERRQAVRTLAVAVRAVGEIEQQPRVDLRVPARPLPGRGEGGGAGRRAPPSRPPRRSAPGTAGVRATTRTATRRTKIDPTACPPACRRAARAPCTRACRARSRSA